MARKKKYQPPTKIDDELHDLSAKIITERDPMVLVLRGHPLMEILLNDIVQTIQSKGMPKNVVALIQDAFLAQKKKRYTRTN